MGTLGTVSANPSKSKKDVQKEGQKKKVYDQTSVYGSTFAADELPRFAMEDEPFSPQAAYQLIKDELALDGTPGLNLATFVTTYMEKEAEELMKEHMNVNYIDLEEYPSTAELQNRCVNMIGRLFNAPVASASEDVIGTSTIGSSESIILATLAMKRKWQNARRAAGKSTEKPNIVMNTAVHVCWEKAARYLEVEENYVYCDMDRYVIDPKKAIAACDENTIGVVGILGTTYTGQYEDIKALNDLLDQLEKEKGLDIKIHVDAASGGFVAPFVNPSLVWDFRLPRVVSINASGHKYGLTYAGVGWSMWRSKEYLPEELVFHVNYLGADQASFTLNFSKSASQIIGQYYVLIRNGKKGFTAIMQSVTDTADYLADQLKSMGRFKILNPGHGESLPLVAFTLKEKTHYDVFAIAAHLRQRGWIIPAYTMAPHAEKLKLLRVVCRMDFSRTKCNDLLKDIAMTCDYLDQQDAQFVKKLVEAHKSVDRRKAHSRHVGKTGYEDHHSLQGKYGKTHGVC